MAIKNNMLKTPALLLVIIPVSGFGGFMIGNYYTINGEQGNQCPLSDSDLSAASAYLKFKNVKSSFMPSGVPDVYGHELDISFDKVQDAINKVRVMGAHLW